MMYKSNKFFILNGMTFFIFYLKTNRMPVF